MENVRPTSIIFFSSQLGAVVVAEDDVVDVVDVDEVLEVEEGRSSGSTQHRLTYAAAFGSVHLVPCEA